MHAHFVQEIHNLITATQQDDYTGFITKLVNIMIPDASLEDKNIPLTAFNMVDKPALDNVLVANKVG